MFLQGKTEVLGEEPVRAPLSDVNSTRIDLIDGNYTREPRQGVTLAIFYQNTWCHSRRQSTSLPPP
jgi:hypothetical protein